MTNSLRDSEPPSTLRPTSVKPLGGWPDRTSVRVPPSRVPNDAFQLVLHRELFVVRTHRAQREQTHRDERPYHVRAFPEVHHHPRLSAIGVLTNGRPRIVQRIFTLSISLLDWRFARECSPPEQIGGRPFNINGIQLPNCESTNHLIDLLRTHTRWGNQFIPSISGYIASESSSGPY